MSRYLFLVLVLSVFVFSMADPDPVGECYFKIHTTTGWLGTTANISVVIHVDNHILEVDNLKLLNDTEGQDYPYFQAGQTDVFSFHSPCLEGVSNNSLVNLTLISDGAGARPIWFVVDSGVLISRTEIPLDPIIVRSCTFNAYLIPPFIPSATAKECHYLGPPSPPSAPNYLTSAVEMDGVLRRVTAGLADK